MRMTNFPNGFGVGGVAVRNIPILNTYGGKAFFVSSVNGGGKGSQERPFTSIAEALDQCVHDRGDLILPLPGHVETVTAAAGLAIDVRGVSIIGLGTGSKRPTVNFTTAVGADMDIDAANVTIQNMLFTGGIDALTGPIDINAADCALIGIETRDVTGQATDFIVTDANCDRLLISGWQHRGAAAAGADTAISIVGGNDIIIENFQIYGNFAVAGIENVTTAMARARIGGGPVQNYIWTEHANDILVTVVNTSTGQIGPNINGILKDNAANITEAFAGAAMRFFQPLRLVNLAGESSMETNITASTDA